MKPLRKSLTLCFIFSILYFYAQNQQTIVTSKIESETMEGLLKLKATATNNSENHQELNYLFISIKKSASGNLSNNKQSGKFTLQPEETKKLSEIAVNIQNKDALKVFLYIRNEETQSLISKDSLIINASDFTKKNLQARENNLFELKGLTIDETKTKVGKDFYDAFYLNYSQIPEKFSTAITINELPTTGRGSQINIIIEDKTIYSFVSNPNEDYLVEQAKYSLKFLADYNQKKTLLKNEFRY